MLCVFWTNVIKAKNFQTKNRRRIYNQRLRSPKFWSNFNGVRMLLRLATTKAKRNSWKISRSNNNLIHSYTFNLHFCHTLPAPKPDPGIIPIKKMHLFCSVTLCKIEGWCGYKRCIKTHSSIYLSTSLL